VKNIILCRKVLFSFIFLLALVSCKKNASSVFEFKQFVGISDDSLGCIAVNPSLPLLSMSKGNGVTINVPIEPSQYADSIIFDYKFIPLETTKKNLISRIEKIFVDSTYFFIFDHDNNILFRFGQDGKFLGQIGHIGFGSDEYTEIWNAAIDKKRKEICLLDLSGRKLLYYNYNGSFIRTEPMYYLFTSIEFCDETLILHTGSSYNIKTPLVDYYQLIVSERNQKPLFKGFPITSESRYNTTYGTQKSLLKVDNEVLYYSLFSDTIWQIDKSSCKVKFVLNFPERGILFNQQEIEKMSDELYRQKTNGVDCFRGKYVFTRKFACFSIMTKKNIECQLIYSTKSERIRYGLIEVPKNSNRLGDYLQPGDFDHVYNDSTFIKVLQPSHIKSEANSFGNNNMNQVSQRDKDFANSLKDDGNPVLMLIQLSDF